MGGFTMDKARLEKLGQWAEQDAKEVIFPFWTSDFMGKSPWICRSTTPSPGD